LGALVHLEGYRFERLLVQRQDGRTRDGRVKWLCACSCGNFTSVSSNVLLRGHTRSCGCLHSEIAARVVGKRSITHGDARGGRVSREYQSWRGLLNRCENSTDPAYKNYGGRGITVCRRWHKFENFLADMGRCPGQGYSLDRQDNNKGYTKSNCRWATGIEQGRNRRTNVLIVWKGETLARSEWAVRTGISSETIAYRLKSGWLLDDALTKQPDRTISWRQTTKGEPT
jgi:hypothetical protein